MEVNAQNVLFYAGIACIVIAVILIVLAVVYFVRVDIRAVYADLSGKTRQKELLEREKRKSGGVSSGALAKGEVWHGKVSRGVIKEKDDSANSQDDSGETSKTDSLESSFETSRESKVSKVNDGSNAEGSHRFETETLSLKEEPTDITDDADEATDVMTDVVVDQQSDLPAATPRDPVAFKIVRAEVAVHCESEIDAGGKSLKKCHRFDVIQAG